MVLGQKAAKADVNVLDNLWSFNYRRGSALLNGIVRARDEGTAFLVAQTWCRRNGVRAAAQVRPLVLADERILEAVEQAPVETPEQLRAPEFAAETI